MRCVPRCLAALLLFLYQRSLKRACLNKREKAGRCVYLGEKSEQGSFFLFIFFSEKIQETWGRRKLVAQGGDGEPRLTSWARKKGVTVTEREYLNSSLRAECV